MLFTSALIGGLLRRQNVNNSTNIHLEKCFIPKIIQFNSDVEQISLPSISTKDILLLYNSQKLYTCVPCWPIAKQSTVDIKQEGWVWNFQLKQNIVFNLSLCLVSWFNLTIKKIKTDFAFKNRASLNCWIKNLQNYFDVTSFHTYVLTHISKFTLPYSKAILRDPKMTL